MTVKHTTLFKILFVLYIAAVVWLCFGHFENVHITKLTFLGIPKDKIVHFCMFFPFACFVRWSFHWRLDKGWKRALIYAGAILIGALLAVASEVGQGMTNYRSEDPFDFLADFIGIISGALMAFIIDSFLTKHYD